MLCGAPFLGLFLSLHLSVNPDGRLYAKTARRNGLWLFDAVAQCFLFWQAYQISGFEALSSPGAFPLAAAGIMVISSCVVVVKNARRQSPSQVVDSFLRIFYRHLLR